MITWSWLLTILGISAFAITSKWPRIGWLISIFNQFLWITYGFLTMQNGFIFGGCAYAMVFYMNWIKVKK